MSDRHSMTARANQPEYGAWCGMIARCENPKNDKYHIYGAKGIKVCQRWRHSYAAFLEDMGAKPGPTYSIDRINTTGDYEPSNCRWATQKQQQRNRSNNRIVEFMGRSQCIAAWAEELGLSYKMIRARIRKGWPIRDALTIPPNACHERVPRGERTGVAKLTDEQVAVIIARLSAGESGLSIASAFKISPSAISNIRVGRTWKHIKKEQR